MTFGQDFESEIIPEWREFYFDYAGVKAAISDGSYSDSRLRQRKSRSKTRPPGVNGLERSQTEESLFARNQQQDVSASASEGTSASLRSILESCTAEERDLFARMDAELEKIEKFYKQLAEDAINHYQVLEEQTRHLQRHRRLYKATRDATARILRPFYVLIRHSKQRLHTETDHSDVEYESGGAEHKYEPLEYGSAKQNIAAHVCQFYVHLNDIQEYCRSNVKAFKKCAVLLQERLAQDCYPAYMSRVESSSFRNHTEIIYLRSQLEQIMADGVEHRQGRQAVRGLRAAVAKDPYSTQSTCRTGLYLGLALAIGPYGIYQACLSDVQTRVPQYAAILQIYGSFALPILLALGIGLNIVAWENARINVPKVFSFDHRTHITQERYFELPAFLLFTLSGAIWISFVPNATDIPTLIWPIAWLVSTLAFLINPLPICYYHARWWLIRSVCRVCTAGLLQVEFRDFWIGDNLCSVYYSISNMALMFCAARHSDSTDVASICSTNGMWATAVLACLPFFFRFGQSLRRFYNDPSSKTQLANAAKYALSIVYQTMYYNYRIHGSKGTGRFALWVTSATVNALVSFSWDVRIDWDLLNRNSKHTLLRDNLSYSNHIWFYYVAIVANFCLRFAWTLYLTGLEHGSLKSFANGCLEMIRRWIWNFIRIDAEHVGSLDDYETTRNVPLPYDLDKKTDDMSEGGNESEASEDDSDGNERTGLVRRTDRRDYATFPEA